MHALVRLSALLAVFLVTRSIEAQVSETAVPFDSAGRVTAITPGMAAQLALGLPAWRITGNYRDARLYRASDGSYTIVVTRAAGAVERYPITAEERDILMARTSALPPGFDEQLRGAGAGFLRATRNNAFVRNQTIIGVLFYGPSFAYALTDDAAGRTAAYLLAAGGSFFAASELTRRMEISDSQNAYATHFATRGSLMGAGIAYAFDGGDNWIGAGSFVAGVGGTALGLWLGRGRSVDEAAATGFGADALALMAGIGQMYGRDGWNGDDDDPDDSYPTRSEAGVLVGAGLVGYQLGALYPRLVPYNVTEGDVRSLWVTGGIGLLGASALIAGGETSDEAEAAAVISGFLVGVGLGNYINVRRLDMTLREANLLALGTGAGALMGAGLYVLIDADDDDGGDNDGLARGIATAGAIAGFWLTERYVEPGFDRGSPFSRLDVNPTGLALAAMGARGKFPVLSLKF